MIDGPFRIGIEHPGRKPEHPIAETGQGVVFAAVILETLAPRVATGPIDAALTLHYDLFLTPYEVASILSSFDQALLSLRWRQLVKRAEPEKPGLQRAGQRGL